MNALRHSLALGALAALTCQAVTASADEATPMTDANLAQIIKSIGLTPQQQDSRFDFEFKASMGEEQWQLSMSSVLSQDGRSVWLMAWLDELPKNAADVPRTALLRLLAENDKMGNGKFFAYIANNRRFVLQRVIPTQGLTKDSFKAALQDLGSTVVQTYPQWSVAGWSAPVEQEVQTAARPAQQEPVKTQAVGNDSKYALPVRK